MNSPEESLVKSWHLELLLFQSLGPLPKMKGSPASAHPIAPILGSESKCNRWLNGVTVGEASVHACNQRSHKEVH